MTKHQPLVTRHGTHCICGVFCGSARDSWWSHAEDQLTLNPTTTLLEPKATTPEQQALLRAIKNVSGQFNSVQEAFKEMTRRVGEQLRPLSQALRAVGWRPEPTCETCGHLTDMDLLYAMAKCEACGRSGSHLLPQINAKRGGIQYGERSD